MLRVCVRVFVCASSNVRCAIVCNVFVVQQYLIAGLHIRILCVVNAILGAITAAHG